MPEIKLEMSLTREVSPLLKADTHLNRPLGVTAAHLESFCVFSSPCLYFWCCLGLHKYSQRVHTETSQASSEHKQMMAKTLEWK